VSAQSDIARSDLPIAAARPATLPARRILNALWFSRSIRAQLLIVLVVIDLLAALLAGGVIIVRARAQTRVEMAASMRLAESLVEDAVKLLQQQIPAEQFLAVLPAQLRSIRHVRVAVTNAAGVPVEAANGERGDSRSDDRAPAPGWFASVVAPPGETHEVPVIVNGDRIGDVTMTGEPADEIAEIWENALAFAAVGLVLNAAMIAILYFLFGRVLDPLNVLADGLADLEQQTYSVRLQPPQTKELAALSDRFNALALALEDLSAENLRLNRALITAQDDERRRTALELHDEVGPCLFGLKANASSILSAASGPAEKAQSVAERVRDILGIVEHLQAINRSMLDRLRPMALGHVPLGDILRELVQERDHQQPQTAFSFTAGYLRRGYGDSIDLTMYRCIQECLTNAIRHAKASHVAVELAETRGGLALSMRDDGQGMAPGTPPGFGIRGMQERVEGLGGRYVIDSAPGQGTRIRIFVPFAETAA
jgi:two-component system, NarL family, sensor histidine kinase UhpB